jgi:transcriptional regulator with XRE-family HTH domain
MTIADRIKHKREELGLSQEELAKKCGYADKTSISKIENSGNDITLKKINRIAEALNVSHRYLMGWETAAGHDEGSVVIVAPENDYPSERVDKAMSFLDQYEAASPEIQAAILTLLKSRQQ